MNEPILKRLKALIAHLQNVVACVEKEPRQIVQVKRGRPYGSTKHANAAHWDWTKHNKELSREHMVSIATLSKLRAKLGKPKVYAPSKSLDARRKEWDWSKTDAQLGAENGICRERVRQVRMQLGKAPRREEARTQHTANKQRFINWINGAKQVQRLDAVALGFHDLSVRKWCQEFGIVYTANGVEKKANQFNYSLPNWLIAEAWGISLARVRQARSDGKKQKAPYSYEGDELERQKYLTEFEAEKAKAAEWKEKHKRTTQPHTHGDDEGSED